MILGYYKFRIKNAIKQSIRLFRLRRQHIIGKNCHLNENVQLTGKVYLHENITLGPNVKLKNNVVVGSDAKLNNIFVDENSQIENGVICTGYGEGCINIGKESYIGINNILDWSNKITIGNFVHIAGPSTGLWTHSSAKQCTSGIPLKIKDEEYRPTAPIVIEDYVYIGGNCTIYPGITIGNHSIIAPNSAITNNVEPYSLVGGVPGKLINKLNSDNNS